MPKPGRKSEPNKTQHEKFVELARQLGADERESAFVGKLTKLATARPAPLKGKASKKPR